MSSLKTDLLTVTDALDNVTGAKSASRVPEVGAVVDGAVVTKEVHDELLRRLRRFRRPG
jgi:hypothetical protein